VIEFDDATIDHDPIRGEASITVFSRARGKAWTILTTPDNVAGRAIIAAVERYKREGFERGRRQGYGNGYAEAFYAMRTGRWLVMGLMRVVGWGG